jgi:hypothetical protein
MLSFFKLDIHYFFLHLWKISFENSFQTFFSALDGGVANVVVIASASRTENPWFESRKSVGFFWSLYIAMLLSKT